MSPTPRPKRSTPRRCPLLHEPRDERSDVPAGAPENQALHDRDCPRNLAEILARQDDAPPGTPRIHPLRNERSDVPVGIPENLSPSRLGLSSNRPTRRPKRGSSTQCPTYPPTQERAKRRPGWRSREPGPSRLGLSPQRSPPPSSARAPHEERAGVGAGAVRRRRGGQAPWRRVRAVSAGILAREGGRVGGG